MRLRWLLVFLSLLAASPLPAQVSRGDRDAPGATLRAARDEAGASGLRLGMARVRPPFGIDLPRSPLLEGIWYPGRFDDWAAAWARAVRAGLAARPPRLGALAAGDAGAPGPAADTALALVAADPPADSIAGPPGGAADPPAPRRGGDFADLGMRVSGRGEFGGAWTRFRPCDPAQHFNCNPSLFPLLKPEVQFGVQVGGTISQRIHIDVDYDQRREFDAANNINVYYQGLAGEVLQRLELGDVSIRLPASRYLTEGIPGGNFGFKAAGEVGGLEVQAVWAQQKGDVATREFRLGGARGPEGLVQDASIALDDADYVKGQFFFLADPARLANFPHLDVLALRAEDAPADVRPAAGAAIQLYRDERPSFTNPQQQAQLGYFLAEAATADGALRHSGQFRRLVPGEDYIVHASGLWVMLRSPLRLDEALAVSYRTEAGGAVGTPDAERHPNGTPQLLLLRGPATIHQPGQPTWGYEMHQVYRLDGGNGVEPGSIELRVSLGELAAGATYKDAGGRTVSLLKLFGLDDDPPAERLDEAQLFQPARSGLAGPGGESRFGGTFVVFPTLEPFAAPPPVPSAGLDAAAAAALLGGDANPAIYRNPDPVLREGSGRFRLNFRFRVRVEGLASSFNLGGLGIREGSERITVDGRPLERGVDYTIDYGIGQVTLTNPQAVLGANPNAEIRAAWEQKAAFQLAPKSLFGLSARYPLGGAGELNLVGLYQAEKPVAARPQLGLEPGAAFLGGASGRVEAHAPWLDRAVARLSGRSDTTASRLRLSGELALSVPNPNRRGDTFLDDFEATDEFPLGLDRTLWRLGSRPDDPLGAEGVLPFPLDATTASRLVWQHDLLDAGGRVVGPRLAREIDRQINVAGAQRTEPVLYLTLGDSRAAPGERRWRAITTVLGTTGRDMSRSEYLEFYAAALPGQEMTLVLDVGTVSEDAFAFDAGGQSGGLYPDGRPWGLGILDEEARTAAREIWSAALDSLGLWNAACRADPGQPAYPLGDARANCTRGNGLVDTEDLDGNGILDARDGALFRYVVRLDGSSPFLVRDRNATGTEFALYRIPLRGGVAVGGASEGTWRYIKHLRMSVAGRIGSRGAADVVLARMRVVGSRWTKREAHGILRGIAGTEPGSGAGITAFQAGPVSRVTDGAAYVPPPGVGDELQDPNSAYGGAAVEYNEKSLRLRYEALAPDERAEAYFRYPQQPRNLLSYRELRLWAVPRAGLWGPGGGETLIVSVGTDAKNRYLHRTALRPAPAGGVRPEDWTEVVVDFERWFALKAEAERALITGQRPPGEPVELWSEDGAYGIVLEDRARAPNLAAVRELGFAVHNAAGLPAGGEVWLDELRLGGALADPGVAGHWDLEVRAGELAAATLSYAAQGPLFRHLGRDPHYQASQELGVGATAQFGRLAPAGWGLDLPVTVSHTRTGLAPTFLERSDVRADRLPGLRETGVERTRVGVTLRRSTPTEHPLLGLLLDGASVRFGYQAAALRSITTTDESSAFEGGLGYDRRPAPREVGLLPGFARGVLRLLAPRALEESDWFARLVSARLRWSPEALSLSTGYASQQARSWRYATILATDADTLVAPVVAPREGVETLARLALRPLASLSAGVTLTSHRDLLPSAGAAASAREREAIEAARARPAGVDLGWETNRTLASHLDFRPPVTPWLRPGLAFTARFRSDRSASYWEEVVRGADTVAVLQRSFQGERQWTRSLLLDPSGLTRSIADSAATGLLVDFGRALEVVDLSWSEGVGSRFEREAADPAWGYQLGLGGLEGFRRVGDATAATASAREAFRARSSMRLPGRAGLEVVYGRTATEVLEQRGGRRTLQERTWPDLRLSWATIPLPGALRRWVAHASTGVGIRHTRRAGTLGDLADEQRTGTETGLPLQSSIGLANGLTAAYTGVLSRGTGRDPTGSTELEGAQHALQLTGSFLAPAAWRESLPSPIQVSLRFAHQGQRQCRLQGGTDEGAACIPFVDFLNRQLDLTLDTSISQLNVGFQMSYSDRQSFVGTRSGSSQFQLGLFGEFDFAAGTFAREVR